MFDIQGKLHAIGATEQKTERFRVRKFVLETTENPQYPQHVEFQLTGDRCEALNDLTVGQTVGVTFALGGRQWTGDDGVVRHFNSLNAFEITPLQAQGGAGGWS